MSRRDFQTHLTDPKPSLCYNVQPELTETTTASEDWRSWTLNLSRAFLHSSLVIHTRGHRCEGFCWNVPSNSTSTAQRLQTRSLMCRPTVGLVETERAAKLTRICKTRPALLMQEQQQREAQTQHTHLISDSCSLSFIRVIITKTTTIHKYCPYFKWNQY